MKSDIQLINLLIFDGLLKTDILIGCQVYDI